jgi:hypothetical protein
MKLGWTVDVTNADVGPLSHHSPGANAGIRKVFGILWHMPTVFKMQPLDIQL